MEHLHFLSHAVTSLPSLQKGCSLGREELTQPLSASPPLLVGTELAGAEVASALLLLLSALPITE